MLGVNGQSLVWCQKPTWLGCLSSVGPVLSSIAQRSWAISGIPEEIFSDSNAKQIINSDHVGVSNEVYYIKDELIYACCIKELSVAADYI